jgi:hypothetical protein
MRYIRRRLGSLLQLSDSVVDSFLYDDIISSKFSCFLCIDNKPTPHHPYYTLPAKVPVSSIVIDYTKSVGYLYLSGIIVTVLWRSTFKLTWVFLLRSSQDAAFLEFSRHLGQCIFYQDHHRIPLSWWTSCITHWICGPAMLEELTIHTRIFPYHSCPILKARRLSDICFRIYFLWVESKGRPR